MRVGILQWIREAWLYQDQALAGELNLTIDRAIAFCIFLFFSQHGLREPDVLW